MGRARGLLLCYGLAALLCAAWLALRAGEGTPQPVSPAREAAYEMMYSRDVSKLRTLRVTLPDGGYTVRSSMVYDEDGQLLGVSNALGQPFVVEGAEDFALDTTAFQMMLLCAQNLPYTARYEALDADACGLAAPAARIDAAYAGGETLSLAVGSRTPSGASCYVRMAGDEAVYLVPSDFYDVMTRPLNAQHRLPGALARDTADAVQAAVVTPEQTVLASRRAQEERTQSVLAWRVEQPIVHDGDAARIEALVSGIAALRAEAYAGKAQDAPALAAYGLDRPTRLLAAYADGAIRDVRLGADAGGGRVYAAFDQSGDVYLIGREQLAFLDGAGLDDLLDRFVALVPATALDSLLVRTPAREAELSQTWGGADETQPSAYAVAGRETGAEAFSALYRALIGLQFDKTAPADAAGGEPLAVFTYRMRGGGERTVRFAGYDRRYALAVTDGGGRFLLRRERLEQALDALWEEIDDETD